MMPLIMVSVTLSLPGVLDELTQCASLCPNPDKLKLHFRYRTAKITQYYFICRSSVSNATISDTDDELSLDNKQ